MNEYINRSLSFNEYVGLLERLLSEGKTTGPNQSESMVGYGRLNLARIGGWKRPSSRMNMLGLKYLRLIWIIYG